MEKVFFLAFVVILITSCNSQKADYETITLKEKNLFDSLTLSPDVTKANEIIRLYSEYADKYPDDTNSIKYLFRAAEINSNIGKVNESIILLNRIIKNYPQNNLIPIVLHYKGFLFEERLKDYEKAKLAYSELIRRFPDTELALSARACIDNLGKTDEQIIEEFEKMQSLAKDSNSAN